MIAIPLFMAASRLGLIDSKLSLILVYLSFNLPIVIWILRGFFLGIPPGLEQAARMDGASVCADISPHRPADIASGRCSRPPSSPSSRLGTSSSSP